MDRDISPPAPKRRRVNNDESTEKPASATTLEIPDSALQVYSWNINGITPFVQRPITSFFKGKDAAPQSPQPSASLRDFLRRHGWPTMLFLQEVKINPTDTVTQRAVERAVRAPADSSEPDYRAYFCLPNDKYNARGFGRKVYGVCSIIRQEFVSGTKAKVRTVDWDVEGRFQVIEVDQADKDSGIPRLSIWNIYAVNGTENPYKDSNTGEVVGTRHDRKLAVHKHLLDECKRLERDGYAVILAGDLNIARDRIDGHPNLRTRPEQHVRNRADFNEKFFDSANGLKAIDTFRHLHPEERRYTYFPRGGPFGYSCDRVDLIMCSKTLEDNLATSGMLDTQAERGPSDHVPLFATFAFGSEQTKAAPANTVNT